MARMAETKYRSGLAYAIYAGESAVSACGEECSGFGFAAGAKPASAKQEISTELV